MNNEQLDKIAREQSEKVCPCDEINGKFYPFYMIGGKKYYHYIQKNLVEFDTKEQANEYLED
jgi:hypothetical protein